MKHRFKRPAAIVALAAALMVGVFATTAWAHVQVKSTSPAKGSTVKKSLKSVKVTFTGPIRKGTVTVKNAYGTKVSNGTGGRDPRNISRLVVSLKSGLKAGKYTVKWTCTAADGHKQNGTFTFKLKN